MNVGTCFPLNGKIETECLSVALFQMGAAVGATTVEDVDKNIDKIFEYIDRTVVGMPGVEMIVTPETILHGFSAETASAALDIDGPQVQRLKDKCKELKIWLIVGGFFDFKDGEFMKNCAITINDKGEVVSVYSKTTPWNPVEPSTPGDEIFVFDGPKGAKIGVIICSDGDYQDSWREASHKGANVIVRISEYMTPYEDAYEITNRAGAYFNRCYVLATNSSEQDEGYCWFGRSMAVNPEGNIIAQAPVGIPYVFKVDIYPGLCDHIRKQALMGDMLWLGNHRGAASPDTHGIGRDKSMYSYIENVKR